MDATLAFSLRSRALNGFYEVSMSVGWRAEVAGIPQLHKFVQTLLNLVGRILQLLR